MQTNKKQPSKRINKLSVTIQIKATEQYFPVVLFIVLNKVVLTFETVDEFLWIP